MIDKENTLQLKTKKNRVPFDVYQKKSQSV